AHRRFSFSRRSTRGRDSFAFRPARQGGFCWGSSSRPRRKRTLCFRSVLPGSGWPRGDVKAYQQFLRPHPKRPCPAHRRRSEEHTSELQSRSDLVCRLLLEKKKKQLKLDRI